MSKPVVLAVVGVALLAALSGCTSSVATITQAGGTTVAQAAPVKGFVETDKVDELQVKLSIQPFQPGENSFSVRTRESGIAEIQCQVIMLEMGHGLILDMEQASPGHWQVKSPVIDMDGKWMIRVKMTLDDGTEKLLPFYGKVKTDQPQTDQS